MDTIAYETHCDGGAFGVHRLAVAIPRVMQGKKLKLEVGASVEYPNGRGRMLRFRDGITLRADAQFKDALLRRMRIAGAMGGAILISWPASIKMKLPVDVAEHLPPEIKSHTTILWRQGDGPELLSDGN